MPNAVAQASHIDHFGLGLDMRGHDSFEDRMLLGEILTALFIKEALNKSKFVTPAQAGVQLIQQAGCPPARA